MLKNISPLISPELLKNLAEMGHGDEIVLADAHFPGHSCHHKVVHADGLGVAALISAILPIFELDQYAPPLVMMAPVADDWADPELERRYLAAITPHLPNATIAKIERFAFYARTKQAFCVVMTGETGKYGNIILKKGVQPVTVI